MIKIVVRNAAIQRGQATAHSTYRLELNKYRKEGTRSIPKNRNFPTILIEAIEIDGREIWDDSEEGRFIELSQLIVDKLIKKLGLNGV